ncbi:hypothetical protein BDV28DRAFT_145628 [Aspergillus coremiiformis]|uniref:Uncharacterized protein n=1 Tax=Aspergillus coremiiformis TaxID=138285 RepID=A0A5N6ZFJ0_9EURO|nr:hypothetical protein BDV28DRAFT_145628 [Aspergillus coremiiformis]
MLFPSRLRCEFLKSVYALDNSRDIPPDALCLVSIKADLASSIDYKASEDDISWKDQKIGSQKVTIGGNRELRTVTRGASDIATRPTPFDTSQPGAPQSEPGPNEEPLQPKSNTNQSPLLDNQPSSPVMISAKPHIPKLRDVFHDMQSPKDGHRSQLGYKAKAAPGLPIPSALERSSDTRGLPHSSREHDNLYCQFLGWYETLMLRPSFGGSQPQLQRHPFHNNCKAARVHSQTLTPSPSLWITTGHEMLRSISSLTSDAGANPGLWRNGIRQNTNSHRSWQE